MLRRDRQIRMQTQQLADAVFFGISLWLAFVFRLNPAINVLLNQWFGAMDIDTAALEKNNWLYFAVGVAAPLVLEAQRFYDQPPLAPRWKILWPLIKSCFLINIGLILAVYAFHLVVPRGVTTFFGAISFILMWGKEEVFRLVIKSKFGQSQYKRRFILAGAQEELNRMTHDLEGKRDDTIAIVAQFNLSHPLPELIQLLHDHAISGVILSAKRTYFEQIENVIKACELEGVEVWLVADFFTTQISKTTFDELLGRPLLVFSTVPEASLQGVFKQILDFFGALVLLILLSPVFVAIILALRFGSRGPVFFRQQRSGINGAPFTLYKFRTMVTNAEQFKHELEAMNEMRGPVFKVTNDPRITRIGKVLRRFSLDELPQLWNVLCGEMSLVGPRPLPVDEVKRFNDLAHRRRLSVKPGLTCLWQISGRNKISDFKDWVRLDLEYIDNWSLWLDLKILFKTIPAVFVGTGAK